jgi:hypothetical protein
VAALDHLLTNDKERFWRIYLEYPCGQAELVLTSKARRITCAQLQVCLDILVRVYLPTGLAAYHVSVAGVDLVAPTDSHQVKARLTEAP